MKLRQGQIVAITTGEYSDYCLRDHMRALKDFDAVVEAARFKETQTPEKYEHIEPFLAWCIREQLLTPVETGEVVELYLQEVRGELAVYDQG